MVLINDKYWSRFKSEYDKEIVEWEKGILKNRVCLVCGEKVLDKKPFIWWRGAEEIIICSDCAEHTISGMSRDLLELKGDSTSIGKKGEKYSIVKTLKAKTELEAQQMNRIQQIVQLQELLRWR